MNQIFSPSYILAALGWAAGSVAGEVYALQMPAETQIAWWQHSAVISALVVAVFMLFGKLLDNYKDGKKEKVKRDDELCRREIQFWKDQHTLKHISEFEARQRTHRAFNELNRIHSHVYECHRLMSAGGIGIPEFKLKFYEELMQGLDEEVAKFKASLAERLDEAIHSTNRE